MQYLDVKVQYADYGGGIQFVFYAYNVVMRQAVLQ